MVCGALKVSIDGVGGVCSRQGPNEDGRRPVNYFPWPPIKGQRDSENKTPSLSSGGNRSVPDEPSGQGIHHVEPF